MSSDNGGNRPRSGSLSASLREEAAAAAGGLTGSAREVSDEELRRLAEERGLSLQRRAGSRRPRPAVVKGGVTMTLKVDAELRPPLELARLQMNMTFTEMVNNALRLYLTDQGFVVGSPSAQV